MPCQHMCSSGNLSDKGWALSPRDLVRQSTTGTCADAVCELGAFPRHLLNQNIFKGQAATKPLLLVTKSSTWWLRHKEASCYLYKYLNSPSLASTLLLALLIRRSNSKTRLPACPFWVLCIDFYRFRWICKILYKNTYGEMETLCIHLTT